jgi:hypothetical protein
MLLAVAPSGTAAAVQVDSARLSIERIYGSHEFAAESFGPSRPVDSGAAYTTLEPSCVGRQGQDVVRTTWVAMPERCWSIARFCAERLPADAAREAGAAALH